MSEQGSGFVMMFDQLAEQVMMGRSIGFAISAVFIGISIFSTITIWLKKRAAKQQALQAPPVVPTIEPLAENPLSQQAAAQQAAVMPQAATEASEPVAPTFVDEALLAPETNVVSSSATPNRLGRFLSPAQKFLIPSDKKRQLSINQRLLQAGFDQQQALLIYHGIKALMVVVLGLLAFALSPWLPDFFADNPMMTTMFGAAAGIVLPSKILNTLRTKRQQQLIDELPQMLDMLQICLSAGLNIIQGLERIQIELHLANPLIAAEVGRITAKLKAGLSYEEALREFSERSGLPEVRGLVGLLIESHRRGYELSKSLRDYTKDFRALRLHRAELRAAKVSTNLIFPMVTCIWPSFFLVAVGPSIILLIEAFSS